MFRIYMLVLQRHIVPRFKMGCSYKNTLKGRHNRTPPSFRAQPRNPLKKQKFPKLMPLATCLFLVPLPLCPSNKTIWSIATSRRLLSGFIRRSLLILFSPEASFGVFKGFYWFFYRCHSHKAISTQ